MSRKLFKWALRIGLAVAVLTAFARQVDRGITQLDYKMCTQVPQEVRQDECEWGRR